MLRLLMASVLVAGLCLPAEAHIVYLKDGRRLEGTMQVLDSQLTVTRTDGTAETVGYDQVQGVSLDNQELYPKAAASRTPEWATWAVVGSNLVAIATVIFLATRAK
jgi:hypothetical protein